MEAHTESHEEMMKRHREEKARHREHAKERASGGEAGHEKRRARGGEAMADTGDIGDDGSMRGMEHRTAGDPDVVKEAERRAKGGAIRKEKMPRMVHGEAPRHHTNRPGRKSGGSVGADSHPMTEASRLKMPEGLSRDGGVDREDD